MAQLKVEVLVGLVDRLTKPLARMGRNLRRTGSELSMIGAGAAYGGRQLLMPLQGAVQASMALESAMADVRKVVDFDTPTGLADLQAQLEQLSTQIPLTASQLAQIAAAGGQLGIAAPDLPNYTETVAKAATAFDMLPDEAGLAMAKLANVYKIPIADIGRLGDAINYLSNNAAASAPEVVDALTRAGNAAQFGLAAKETAAYATAMIALGETPERAGTALNFLLQRLQTASKQTPKFQAALAEIGYSAEQLERDVAEGPNAALMGLIETLGQLDAQTGMGVLTGLVGTDHSAKIAKLVNNLDETRRVMGLVANESDYAGSMQAEFAARADTTANRLQLLANRIESLKRALGNVLLPVIEDLSNRLGPLLDKMQTWIAANPRLASNVTLAVAALGALGVVLGPVIIGLGMLVGGAGMLAGGLSSVAAFAGLAGKGLGGIKVGALASATNTMSGFAWAAGLIPAATGKAAAGVRGLFAPLVRLKAGGFAGVIHGITSRFRGMALALALTKASGLSRVLFIVRLLGAALLALPIGWVGVAIAAAAVLIYKFWGPISGFFAGLWQGIVDGLAPVRDALSRTWEGIAPVVQPVADAFGSVARSVGPLIGKLLQLIAPMSDADGAARSLGQTIGYWLVSPWRLIAAGIERVGAAASHLSGLWQQVAAAFDIGFVQGLQKLAANVNPIAVVISTIDAAFPELRAKIASVAQGIIDSFKGILSPTALFSIGADLLRGLGRGIASAVGGVVESVKAAGGKIVEAAKSRLGIQSPSTVFAAIGVDLIDGLKQGLGAADSLPGWLSGKLAALSAVVPDALKITAKADLGSAESDVDAFAANSARAMDRLPESAKKAAAATVTTWGESIGQMIAAIGRLVDAAATLPGRIATIMQAVLAAIRSVLSPMALFQVGVDLFRGLTHGIRSALVGVIDTVRAAASSVVQTAKGALGVQSPSWIFADIGANLIAGLKQGLAPAAALPDWLAARLSGLANAVPKVLPAAVLAGSSAIAAAAPMPPMSAQSAIAAAAPMPPMSAQAAALIQQPIVQQSMTIAGQQSQQPRVWTPPHERRAQQSSRSPMHIEMPITIHVTASPSMDEHALAGVIEQRMRAAAGDVARHLSAIYDDPDEV